VAGAGAAADARAADAAGRPRHPSSLRRCWAIRGRSPASRAGHDLFTWTVTDDWPHPVPVTKAEIEVFEQWFDELFGSGG